LPLTSRRSALEEAVTGNARRRACCSRMDAVTWLRWALGRALPCLILLQIAPGLARASLDPDKPITQFIHQDWQTAQGLPQNSILSIAQTTDGYLWLGTEDGLVRFDGVRFAIFDKHSIGLESNLIKVLLADRKGNLWVGSTAGGLSRLSHGRFTSYTTANGLSNNSILSLYEDGRGTLWIGTDGGGLIRYQNGGFHVFTKAQGLLDNVVFAISGDTDGNLWIGTQQGLSELSNGRFRTFTSKNGLGSSSVRSIFVDRKKTIWVGTSADGLYRLGATGIKRFTTKDGLTSNAIFSLYGDNADSLWIGTASGGLDRLANGKFSSFTEKEGLVGKDAWTILGDREGTLWIGTESGLNSLKNGSFTNLSKEDGLLSNLILGVYEDREGALWMGSDQGLMRWKDGHVTAYTTKQGLPDNQVFSITQGPQGSIWIGTGHGVARLRDGKFDTFGAKEGLPNGFVVCTYTDRSGVLWVGTRGGLSRFDGHRFVTYTTQDGLSNNYVLSIYEDAEGTLWIGTGGGGLNRFKNGKFSAYGTRNGLSSDVVFSIDGDADGTLWLATDGGGLDRLRHGKFTSYTAYKGLYDDAIFQILDDRRGRLWMSSDRGVFSVSKRQLNDFAQGRISAIASTVYGTADGMKSRECNGAFQPAGWRRKDGVLCFPTTKGLAMVNPSKLVRNEVPPVAILERVLVDNKDVPFDKPLTIPPGKGQLEFQFTAPSSIAPEKIQFRYMLEGFDKDWTQAGSRRIAYYTNIPHGKYRFRVRAGFEDTWEGPDASVSLTLEPHYYQTTIFFVFIGILGISLFAAVYRLRISQLKASERKLVALVDERTSDLQESENQLRHSRDGLELRVQERTSELVGANQALEEEITVRRRTEEQLTLAKEAAESASRAKSDFLANMSHEIRTPINGIVGMTDVTLGTALDDEQREYLEIVKLSADSLLGIVNDILDFSKIEARKLTLDHAPFQLRTSLDDLIRSVALRARQKNLSLTLKLEPGVPNDLVGDLQRLRQVLLNLLDNAIKFTDNGGVSLSVSYEDMADSRALLHFDVTDTGIGIPADKQRTIFEAFTQADTSSTRRYGGTGLGLTISYQLAAMMGGYLWVESQPGSGSTFHFTARLGVSAETPAPVETEIPAPVPA